MSMDFSKHTYRPSRTDNRFRTSYALMSQWMNRQGSAEAYRKEPLNPSFAIAMQGNAAFPKPTVVHRGPVNAEGAPPIYDTAKQAAVDENIPVHLRFSEGAGYDDFHRAYQQLSKQWPATGFPEFGPPRLRHGRAGGSWRHVKEVLQAGGARIVFVDGVIRLEDGTKIDDIPGGHLIQPKIEDIKSRHMISARTQKMPSANGAQKAGETRNATQANLELANKPKLQRSMTQLPYNTF